ncbi:PadR family transcriptional regulator [Tessaracoccus sp. MC1627]|uniref:PadR family transcriptional regulator n=1 Tax=Tessaracoccus sp. MC1627 TaxID=2760312 RepID=UPI0015FF572E|nr:PadR family transcriptional regulator [Tessaracoccus sp. MC1627]
MIELMVLGFLAEGPLHGYELRHRMERLHGYARAISDGTLYPALKRLEAAGLVQRDDPSPGRGAVQRQTLRLTGAGLDELRARLRGASGHDITDGGRFFVVLAFLSNLPAVADQHAVLRRRFAFLDEPGVGFFYDGDRALGFDEVTDPYRRGIMLTAGATSRAERAWLRDVLEGTR